MEIEKWKYIPKTDNKYLISSLGRVRNREGKILSQNRWFEYMEIKIPIKNKMKHFKVHRLVAEAFIPNPENKEQVNHIDGITFHNEASNLEWCSDKENKEHRRKLWRVKKESIMP